MVKKDVYMVPVSDSAPEKLLGGILETWNVYRVYLCLVLFLTPTDLVIWFAAWLTELKQLIESAGELIWRWKWTAREHEPALMLQKMSYVIMVFAYIYIPSEILIMGSY